MSRTLRLIQEGLDQELSAFLKAIQASLNSAPSAEPQLFLLYRSLQLDPDTPEQQLYTIEAMVVWVTDWVGKNFPYLLMTILVDGKPVGCLDFNREQADIFKIESPIPSEILMGCMHSLIRQLGDQGAEVNESFLKKMQAIVNAIGIRRVAEENAFFVEAARRGHGIAGLLLQVSFLLWYTGEYRAVRGFYLSDDSKGLIDAIFSETLLSNLGLELKEYFWKEDEGPGQIFLFKRHKGD